MHAIPVNFNEYSNVRHSGPLPGLGVSKVCKDSRGVITPMLSIWHVSGAPGLAGVSATAWASIS